jgi:hypothetical protein
MEKMICRRVKVNRSLTPDQMITMAATGGRKRCVDDQVLASMPRILGSRRDEFEELDMIFILADRSLDIDEADDFLSDNGLVNDCYGLIQANIDDPEFADAHPNCAQWDHSGTTAAFLVFMRDHEGEHIVSCGRGGYECGYNANVWFGGRRKT